MIKAMIITNDDSVGGILQLCQDKRGYPEKFRISLAHARHAYL